MIDFWFTGFVLVISLLIAVGGSLFLVGYLFSLTASFSFGWRWWLPTLLLPVIGPLAFDWRHRPECRRPGLQLAVGVGLLGIAGAMLYGGGPYLVEHMAGGAR